MPVVDEELDAFCREVERCGVYRIIESGRGELATSTERFATMTPQHDVISIDWEIHHVTPQDQRERLIGKGVNVVIGNACAFIPAILVKYPEPCALFIDGPKGEIALQMIRKCWERYPQIKVVALHNCHPDGVASEQMTAQGFRELFHRAVFVGRMGLATRVDPEIDGPLAGIMWRAVEAGK